MEFQEYQDRAAETALYPNPESVRLRLADEGYDDHQIATIMEVTFANAIGVTYTGLGLGEAGEVQNKVKKILRDDGGDLTTERRDAIAAELGGNLWYISQMAREIGLTLDDIAHRNLDELASRKGRSVIQGSGDDR